MKGDWGCAGSYTREHVLTVQVTAQPRGAISRNLTEKQIIILARLCTMICLLISKHKYLYKIIKPTRSSVVSHGKQKLFSFAIY